MTLSSSSSLASVTDARSVIAGLTEEFGAEAQVFELTPVQTVFWTCEDRYQDLEGAVRSGKTTVCLLKVGHRCEQHPGLHAMISRWHEKDTYAQLKARFDELFGHRCTWNAEEQYFEFPERFAGLCARSEAERRRQHVLEVCWLEPRNDLSGSARGDPAQRVPSAQGATVATRVPARDVPESEST
jgi:hypothetical protein